MKIYLSFINVWVPCFLMAQLSNGALQSAMGNTSATHQDVYAILYNPAGLVGVKQATIGLMANRQFLIMDVNDFVASAAIPIKNKHVVAASSAVFGYSKFLQSNTSFAYAITLGNKFNLGTRLNLHSLHIDENGSKFSGGFALGLRFLPTEKIRVGSSIYLPIIANKISDNQLHVPSKLVIGLSYHPSKEVMAAIEVEQSLNRPVNLKFGIDYKFHSNLSLRLGGMSYPIAATGGIGLEWNSVSIDTTITWQLALGLSSQIGLQYALNKTK